MTTVAKLIRCLQKHDPNSLVVVQFGDSSEVAQSLNIAEIECVTLHKIADDRYAVSTETPADVAGVAGVLLKPPWELHK